MWRRRGRRVLRRRRRKKIDDLSDKAGGLAGVGLWAVKLALSCCLYILEGKLAD